MKCIFFLPVLVLFAGHTTAQDTKYLQELYSKLSGTDDSARMAAMFRLGAYYSQQEKDDSNIFYYKAALKIAKEKNYPLGICAGYNSLGENEYKYERMEAALNYYLKALEVSEKNKFYSSMGVSYGSMARIFGDQQKPERAFEYYKKSLAALVKAKDTIRMPVTYVNLSGLLLENKQTELASTYADSALMLSEQLLKNENRPNRVAALKMYRRGALDVKGKVAMNLGLYDEAEKIFIQLSKEVEEVDDPEQQSSYLISLAYLYNKKREYSQSLGYVNKVRELLLKDSIAYLYQSVYELEAENYKGLKQYEKALTAHMKYKSVSDSILNKENLSITEEMQARYETEKKEQQITSLNQQKKNQRTIIGVSVGAFVIALGFLLFALRANRLQKKLFAREKELQKKELERKMFDLEQTALRAQMNPHFIFNSLNSVQRFVINNDAEGVNQYLSTFAALIRQTLENSGKQLIPLKDELHYLETYLRLEQMRSNNKFMYSIRVNEDVDTEDTFIPNMIIQPYLENSVIHGMAGKQKEEGMINLTISKNHKLTCVVEDNGIGFKKSQLGKATETPDHESMGTAITERRIEMFNSMHPEKIELQLDDKSEMDNTAGTRVMIKFPLNSAN
jgi:tetratricopeptide (TPR) repeat protein